MPLHLDIGVGNQFLGPTAFFRSSPSLLPSVQCHLHVSIWGTGSIINTLHLISQNIDWYRSSNYLCRVIQDDPDRIVYFQCGPSESRVHFLDIACNAVLLPRMPLDLSFMLNQNDLSDSYRQVQLPWRRKDSFSSSCTIKEEEEIESRNRLGIDQSLVVAMHSAI